MRRKILRRMAALLVAVSLLASSSVFAAAVEFPAETQEEPGSIEAPVEADGETPVPPDGEGEAGGNGLPQLETEAHIVYMEGSEDLVNPGGNLRRSEAAKIVCTLLKEPEAAEPQAGLPSFSDVPDSQWFAPYVQKLAGLEILTGYPDGTFGPNRPITRAEFVQVLSKFFEPVESEVSFSDVTENHWAYQAISTAVAKGWTKGYPDGTFCPGKNITRAEAVTMVNRVLGRQADKGKIDQDGKVFRFLDLPTGHWAYYDFMEASLPHTYTDGDGGEAWDTYTVPAAQRGKGPQYVGGELYYVGDDGHYVRNKTVGTLQFNANGRYTSGDAQLDTMLSAIVKPRCKDTNTPLQNLRIVFDFVYAQTHYRANTYIADGATGWINSKAKETIRNGYKGNCYNYAALMTVLARRIGVQATAYSGYAKFTFQSYWAYHAWCEVTVDGKKYICDPELEANFVKNLGLGWKLYMVPYSQLPYKLRCKGVVFQ